MTGRDWGDSGLIVLLVTLLADYVKRFATEEALRDRDQDKNGSSDSESSMSEFSEDEAQDMEL